MPTAPSKTLFAITKKLLTVLLVTLLFVSGLGLGFIKAPGASFQTAYGAQAPGVGDFVSMKGTKAGRFQIVKNAQEQTVVSYQTKNGWEGIEAPVSDYSKEYTRLSVTMALQGTKQVGIELVIPGKANQVIRYADLALNKQSVINADGSYTFDIPLSGYKNIQSNGISAIIIYLDATSSISGICKVTILDIGFRKAGEAAYTPSAPPVTPTEPSTPPTVTPTEPPTPPTPPTPTDPTTPTPTPGNPLANITSYACYYGDSSALDKLKNYDMVIINFDTLGGAKSVAELKAAGVIVIAYISIGEEDLEKGMTPQKSGNDWYLPNAKSPLKTSWGGYFVDTSNPNWRAKIHNYAKSVLAQGVDGFFYDTVEAFESDKVKKIKNLRGDTISLIKELDVAHPNAIKVMNRGFSIVDDVINQIDCVMFEEFSTTTSYTKWSGKDLAWTEDTAIRLQKLTAQSGLKVIALDYASTKSSSLVAYSEKRAKQFGFLSYVATKDLVTIL